MNLVILFQNKRDFAYNLKLKKNHGNYLYSKFFNYLGGMPMYTENEEKSDQIEENGWIQGDYFLMVVRDESLFVNGEVQDPFQVEMYNIWLKQLELLKQKLTENLKIYLVLHKGGISIQVTKSKDNPQKLETIEKIFEKQHIPNRIHDGSYTPTVELIENLSEYYANNINQTKIFNGYLIKYINSVFTFQEEFRETLNLLLDEDFKTCSDIKNLRSIWIEYLRRINNFRLYNNRDNKSRQNIFNELVNNSRAKNQIVIKKDSFETFKKELLKFIDSRKLEI